MTARCVIRIRKLPGAPARKVVGAIEFVSDDRTALDGAIDEMIDHRGAAEMIAYEIRDGRKIIAKGESK